jgi:hypothetical protein
MTTPKRLSFAAILLLSLSGAAGATSQASSFLYERTLMREAGARCRLFTPEIAAALAAAAAQARGAALRSGDAAEAVAATEGRAALKAYAVACDNPDLKIAADRVRKAFAGYAEIRTMSFPGTFAAWSADRRPWPLVVDKKVVPGPRWRLSQAAQGVGGALTVGLASGPELLAVSTSPDAAEAYAARLVIRDPAKASQPMIDPRRPNLAGRTSPLAVTRAFLAQSLGPAPQSLVGPRGRGVLAVFPAAATAALAALDPREAATVEFLFPSGQGERVEAASIEVGDFAAGRAFLAAGR